jgi:hypothetical protein
MIILINPGSPVNRTIPLMKRKVSGYLYPDSSRNVIAYKKSLPSIVNYTPYSRIYSDLKPLKLIIVHVLQHRLID